MSSLVSDTHLSPLRVSVYSYTADMSEITWCINESMIISCSLVMSSPFALLQMTRFTASHLFIQVIDIFVSIWGQLWRVWLSILKWSIFIFSLAICSVVGMLSHMIILFQFWKTVILFCIILPGSPLTLAIFLLLCNSWGMRVSS